MRAEAPKTAPKPERITTEAEALADADGVVHVCNVAQRLGMATSPVTRALVAAGWRPGAGVGQWVRP